MRFWNPTRYQRWTSSQVSQAMKPLSRRPLMSATAAARPIVARLPLSRYRKGGCVPAAQPTAHRAGGVATLLHRRRRDPRKDAGRAVVAAYADHVAEHHDLRMAGKRQVGLDGHAPRAVEFRAAAFGELGGERRSRDAGGPDDGARGDPLRLMAAVLHRDRFGVDADHGATEQWGHAEPLERSRGLRRKRRWEAREHPIGRLDQQDASGARVHGSEVAAERVARELGNLAGHLDSGRAAADHREREPARTPLRVRLHLGSLEGARGYASARGARSRAT